MNRQAPASITDLHAFRRDRITNDWFVVLFVTCLSVCGAWLALDLARMVGDAARAGF